LIENTHDVSDSFPHICGNTNSIHDSPKWRPQGSMESKKDSLDYSLDGNDEWRLSTMQSMMRPCRSYIECKRLKRPLFDNSNFISYSKFRCHHIRDRVFLNLNGKVMGSRKWASRTIQRRNSVKMKNRAGNINRIIMKVYFRLRSAFLN
jgi:hypothetical protein